MKRGFLSRILALLIAAVCLLSCCAASADVVKGSVSHGFYDNNNGISFTVPEGFTLSQQQNKKAGFFRIVLSSPTDGTGFAACITLDIIPRARKVADYSYEDFIGDITTYKVSWDDDIYTDFYKIKDKVYTDLGTDVHEFFAVGHLNRWGSFRNTYVYGINYSTNRSFVRLYYSAFGAQRTMPTDIQGMYDLYNSLIVP